MSFFVFNFTIYLYTGLGDATVLKMQYLKCHLCRFGRCLKSRVIYCRFQALSSTWSSMLPSSGLIKLYKPDRRHLYPIWGCLVIINGIYIFFPEAIFVVLAIKQANIRRLLLKNLTFLYDNLYNMNIHSKSAFLISPSIWNRLSNPNLWFTHLISSLLNPWPLFNYMKQYELFFLSVVQKQHIAECALFIWSGSYAMSYRKVVLLNKIISNKTCVTHPLS